MQVGSLLGGWQHRELRIARSFTECQGLSREQLEDLYQETTLALLNRAYINEEHLQSALRRGLKHRALNLHRDESTHARIQARYARGAEHYALERRDQHEPEQTALLKQDRLVVKEFLAELTPVEQPVFWAMVEGMRYRAIATALDMTANEARNAARACERKRERFQRLYDTGRLCGYRAATIRSLQEGTTTSEELANRAIAHVERCAACRAEHRTNARRLKRAFEGQATALLPLPALLTRAGWITRLLLRTRTPLPGLPEPALLASATAGGQIAARATAIAVLAAGALTATHTLTQSHAAPPPRHATALTKRPETPPSATHVEAAYRPPAVPHERPRPTTPGHVVEPHHFVGHTPENRTEPGGFAYLGVPAPAPRRAPQPAREEQQGGGPFGP